MEEYHERRHLLVHRLGKTDQAYRDKYNTSKQSISIDETYLLECIADFKFFGEMVNNQMTYKLQNDFIKKSKKEKIVERKLVMNIGLISNLEPDYFQPNFEFWAGEDFSIFSDILDNKKMIDDNNIEFTISGTLKQVKSFSKIIRKAQRQKELTLEFKVQKTIKESKIIINEQRILDEEILTRIKDNLPSQPWEKGIHKKVAAQLNVSNKLVSIAIQQLITRKIFKQQIDGILIEESQDFSNENEEK